MIEIIPMTEEHLDGVTELEEATFSIPWPRSEFEREIKENIPFIITDEVKLFYYRGLSEWGQINGCLTDTCLTAQDQYKALLDYFKIRCTLPS